MKKLFVCLALILCLAIPSAFAADTVEEWNEGSDWRIAASADIWNLPSDAGAGAEPVITLPVGTMVRVIADAGEWLMIDYYAGGSVRSGAVRGSKVMSANGVATPAPTASPTPIPLATAAPNLSVATPAPTPVGNGMLMPVGETEPTSVPTAVPAEAFKVTRRTEIGTEQGKLVQLGSVATVLEISGQQQTVATSTIEDVVAVISAPKGGEATLRAAANAKAEILGKLKDGTLVILLERTNGFCRVTDGTNTGYVTDITVVTEDVVMTQALGTGKLCTSAGKTTGKEGIKIRAGAKKSAKQTYTWMVGTQVTVLRLQDGWYLVEVDGCRGYVNKSFVKLDK